MAAIAVLGTGRMGTPMARRLVAAGHPVTAWNRTPSGTAATADGGARVARTPADAVRDADAVLVTLADDTATEAVLFGTGGAAAALRPGTCLVQMATVAPESVRALAGRVPEGVDVVDAPVAGSVDAAAAGALTLLVGGADAAVDRVRDILAALGTCRRCGPVGSGAAVKLVLNTAMISSVAVLADALEVARTNGVPAGVALDALSAGPLAGVVRRARSTTAAFAVAMAGKDLRLALDGLPAGHAPVARATARALRAFPDPAADLAALVPKEHR